MGMATTVSTLQVPKIKTTRQKEGLKSNCRPMLSMLYLAFIAFLAVKSKPITSRTSYSGRLSTVFPEDGNKKSTPDCTSVAN